MARSGSACGWLRRFALGAAAALTVTLGGGCRHGESDQKNAARGPAPLPSRPREVVADIVIPSPAALWQAVQTLGGGPLALLPRGPELALGAALGLAPLAATRLDLRGPVAGVVVASPEAAPVFAIRVASGPELVADLTTGAAARYRVERDGQVSVLVPSASSGAASAPGSAPALAVLDDALLVGPRRSFAAAGPYLVRSLLSRADSTGPVSITAPGAALAEHIVPALRARWQAQRAELVTLQELERVSRGRPADFAEPKVVMAEADAAVESALAILASLREATLELTLGEARAALALRLAPEAQGSARDLLAAVTKQRALQAMALPAETAVLVFWTRREGAPSGGSNPLRALFGKRLSPEDERALESAFGALDAGLGPTQALGILPDLRVTWRGDVREATALKKGIHDVLGLARREPVTAPLAAHWGRPVLTQTSQRLPGLDEAAERTELTFAPRASAKGKPSPPARLSVGSVVGAERGLGYLTWSGESPLPRLLAAEKGDRALSAEPLASEFLKAAGEVKCLVLIDLAKLGLGATPSPVSLALGSEAEAITLDLVASQGAVQTAVALGMRP